MDQAISISSSSEVDQDDGPLAFLDAFEYPLENNDDWLALFNADNFPEETLERPSKRQRFHGPEETTDDQFALNPFAPMNPISEQTSQETTPKEPAVDEADRLLMETLELFPGISHTYVEGLIARYKASQRLDADRGSNNHGYGLAMIKDVMYEEILEQRPSYPREESENGKRKRESSAENVEDWEKESLGAAKIHGYGHAAAVFLGNEFPHIPMAYIRRVLSFKERFYHTFVALYTDEKLTVPPRRPYKDLKSSRGFDSRTNAAFQGILERELKAAKKHLGQIEAALQKKKDEEAAEQANEKEHVRIGSLIECQCCFCDVPMNRCLPCEGDELHFFCFTCIRRSADTQIGMMKYTLQCFDSSGCQASFVRPELQEVLGAAIMEKLDSLQQDDEIRKADLDGLEDCPFCSYKVVLPPVENDKEFRCENTSCKLVSCRLCKEKSHIPMSCEENQKDKGLSGRHQVEEAMSQALIRKCPKCHVQIIKEYGCNKMTCTKCGAQMCYLCQKDITKESYSHFGRGCYQNDSDTQNHDYQQVKKAEQAAIAKILQENPDLTEEQIRVGIQKPQSNQSQNYPGYRYPVQHPGAAADFQVAHAAIRAARARPRAYVNQRAQNRPNQRQNPGHPTPQPAQLPGHPQQPFQNPAFLPEDGLFQAVGEPAQLLGPGYPAYPPGNFAMQPATAAPQPQPQPLAQARHMQNQNFTAGIPVQNFDFMPMPNNPNAAEAQPGMPQLPYDYFQGFGGMFDPYGPS